MAVGVGVAAGALLALAASAAAQADAWILLMMLVLDVTALLSSLGEASWVGVLTAAALWGSHLMGWTLSEPRIPLAGLQVALALFLGAAAMLSRVRIAVDLRRWFPMWLGVLPWVPSVLGASLRGDWLVAGGRLLGAATAALWVQVTLRHDPRRLAWGLVAGTHLVLLLPFFCGITSPLAEPRFSGGACATTHPNILGLSAWTTGLGWLVLPGPSSPARLVGAALGVLLIFLTDARTAAGAGLVGAAVGLALPMGRRARRKGGFARVIGVGSVALLLAAGAFALASSFFLRERAAGVGVLTGRDVIWGVALAEYQAAPALEKLLGTSEGGIGARVERPGQSTPTGSALTTDNFFAALLRRSGAAGLAIGSVGLLLAAGAVVRGLRSGQPATALLVAGLATIPVEDWLFGGSLFVWVALAGALLTGSGDRERRRPE
jgi:hypothetical protein